MSTKHSPKPPVVAEKTPAERLSEQLVHAIEFVVANVRTLSGEQAYSLASALRDERKRREADAASKRPKVGDTVVVTAGPKRLVGQTGRLTSPSSRKQWAIVQFSDKIGIDLVRYDDMEVAKGDAGGHAS